ncbi:MAG TPA: N,N-dimethylformamidase beta subunit family domain-containing protein [Thermoanaerobaculia bacterium]|nr:N,N-dimethylformamidase beta subunit family domain-containing protein [Thermoanaerobaculia bacterium]
MPTKPIWGTQPLEAYASSTSVVAGQGIAFHVSVLSPSSRSVRLEIYKSSSLDFESDNPFARVAASIYDSDYRTHITVRPGERPVYTASFRSAHYDTPAEASTIGCGWPIAHVWRVPADLDSSVYIARLSYRQSVTFVLFVVRSAIPGARSRILLQLPVHTYQAYNPWGGQSFYGTPVSDRGVPQVALDRPCQLWDYILYDQSIVSWFERNYPVELCTNTDLHFDPLLLSPYRLFVSTGHDEYWSGVMRDRIEAFARAGGNVMFLSGNTCYRRVELGGNLMTKIGESWNDPSNGSRWEAETTGVNWSAGRWSDSLPDIGVGFVVRRPRHWVFAGTGLEEGALLGQEEGVIGYETDAAKVMDDNGYPIVTGENGTPLDFAPLATADLTEEPQKWLNEPGYATLGLAWRTRGIVMTAGTTAWGQGLKSDTGHVDRVTRNLVDRLRNPVPLAGILYAVNRDGDLLFYRDKTRDGTGDVRPEGVIGHGGWDAFKFLFSGGNGVLYAVTQDGNLLFYRDDMRDGTGNVGNSKVVGHGGWNAFTSVFSGGDGILYAITAGGDLLFYRDSQRDGTGSVDAPSVIGRGGWNTFTSVFSGGGGILYAITTGGDLLFYRDSNRDGTGSVESPSIIGRGGWNGFRTVFADPNGALYAVTPEGKLIFYRDWTRDGSGNVARGQTIGRSGWETLLRVFSGD